MKISYSVFAAALYLFNSLVYGETLKNEFTEAVRVAEITDKTQNKFNPPDESKIPDGEMGRMIRLGRDIFTHTQEFAKPFVGNDLQCVNCHLDRGRRPDSAPLWGAYVTYPAFRKKTNHVDTLQDRIAGCFKYSMNGKAPAADSETMNALVVYSFWMAEGAPTGLKLSGQGYPKLPKPAREPNFEAGKTVYDKNCSLCHGADGQGQSVDKTTVFPALWGSRSYNWGAGMHAIDTSAGFIKANMPLGLANTLSVQDAWDVAYFVNGHERPKDPRSNGSIEKTQKSNHASDDCLYNQTVDGHRLGAGTK